MKLAGMTTVEKVYSPIVMKGNDIKTAPFWKDCYHEDEVDIKKIKSGDKQWYVYHVKFNGLDPIQLTKTEKIT